MIPTMKLRYGLRGVKTCTKTECEAYAQEHGTSLMEAKAKLSALGVPVLQQWWGGEPKEVWDVDGNILEIVPAKGEWRDVPTEKEE